MRFWRSCGKKRDRTQIILILLIYRFVLMQKIQKLDWLLASILIALTVGLGYFVEQHEFWKIIGLYAPFFAIYAWLIFNNKIQFSIKFWIGVAILLRLILVFAFPNLSNDVYRFIWDGRLLVAGHNPFDFLPSYWLDGSGSPPEGINQALFEAYDSKNFYTVYPPLAQAQFVSACWLFPTSDYWASVVMKAWLLVFEVGSIWLIVKLLRQFKLPIKNALIYALNPLIVFEIVGNLHFEGAMVFFFLAAAWAISKSEQLKEFVLASMAFALSICSKLLTILFLPFFIKIMGWGRAIRFYLLTGVITILLFVPILNTTFISNFGDSLNLYFQKLEYNASLYYLARWIGIQISGYNQIAWIGPGLGILALLGILWLTFFFKRKESGWLLFFEKCLLAICIYLVCTTTLHPWYLALPIVLCCFTRFRFPVVWSGLIFLTYINYSYEPFHENLWVVALEYLIVFGWFLMEWRASNSKNTTIPLSSQT